MTLPHPQWMIDQIAMAVDERIKLAAARTEALVEPHADQILGFARQLVAAPARRLSDDALDAALRAVGLSPPPRAEPVGGTRRTRRRRRR